MAKKVTYSPDSKGQLELDNIDSPIGEKTEVFIAAAMALEKAKKAKDDAELELTNEMKETNVRTIKFKGHRIRYQPGHITPEKIKFMPSDE